MNNHIKITHDSVTGEINTSERWCKNHAGSVMYERLYAPQGGFFILEKRENGGLRWYVLPSADPRLDTLKMYLVLADIPF